MFHLPLFPLNTVLFPGMPLSLHIFEERYKQMIGKCISERQPFGVVLIRSGAEALDPLAEPYSVGCTARISQAHPLSDGKMNIVAVGQERFEIISLDYTQPYLIALVRLFPLAITDQESIQQSADHLRPWIARYLRIIAQADNLESGLKRLPNDPLMLANLAAYLLQIPVEQKQELLSVTAAVPFMAQISAIYRREVTLLNLMISREGEENQSSGQFSLN